MAKKSAAQKSLPVVDEAEAIVESAPAFVDAGVIIEPAQRDDVAVISVPVDSIADSPTNPRKTMGDLSELVESIRRAGVLQPILVRKVNLDGGGLPYEVVFGHRRLHAARHAGLKEVLAQVRDLTDQQVAELQLVENAQREDVSPLEEADAYRRLHEEFGLSADAIAQRVGKSKASVYARMKLGDLKDEKARAALLSGKIDASVALLIARLTPAEQAKASRRIVDGREYDRDQASDDPMSYRQALDYLREELYLHPADAPFDVSDASLVPAAGPCTKCPKRVDVAGLTIVGQKVNADDLCDDAACWGKKVDANRDEKLGAEVERLHVRALSSSENAKLFDEYGHFGPEGSSYNNKTGFVRRDATPDYEDTGSYRNQQTWEQIANAACKKDGSGVDGIRELIVLALDGKGKVVQLLDRKKLLKRAKDAGVLKKKSSSAVHNGYTKPKPKSPEQKVLEAAKKHVENYLIDALTGQAKANPDLDAKMLRFLIANSGAAFQLEGHLKRLGIAKKAEDVDSFEALGKVSANAVRQLGVLVMIEAAGQSESYKDKVAIEKDGTVSVIGYFAEVGKVLGVDVKEIEKRATADVVRELEKVQIEDAAKSKGRWLDENVFQLKNGEQRIGSTVPAWAHAIPKPAPRDPFKKIASAGRKAVKKIVAKSKPKSSKKPKAKK